MAEYLYRNADNDERTIHARMTSPPPETVTFCPDGSWCASTPGTLGEYRRVYVCAGAVVKVDASVNHADQDIPQASRSLAKTAEQGTVVNRFGRSVRELSNGHYATLDGRRIVDSPAARDAHMKETGAVACD